MTTSSAPAPPIRSLRPAPTVRLVRAQGFDDRVRSLVASVLPTGSFRRILLKPNLVKHETDPAFPVRALVTDPRLVMIVLEECMKRYPEAEEITVADAPLQSCDWSRLMVQSGYGDLQDRFMSHMRPSVRFIDLREQITKDDGGYLIRNAQVNLGDPHGYRDVVIDSGSFLEAISVDGNRFRVSDYDPSETTSSHRRGVHRYRISGSLLDADLVVNLPKLKSHQKAGLTGALKNFVGVNGRKANLVHFRKGRPSSRGDEFPPDVAFPVIAQVRFRTMLQESPRWMFALFQQAWRTFRRFYGIEVHGAQENLGKRFFVAAGAWHGNDTIWRMVYDLNRIVRFADCKGVVHLGEPQRAVVTVLDGVVAGEGNGPLEPLPVDLGVVLAGDDPFAVDMAMARLMGFDREKMPTLRHHQLFGNDSWGDFKPGEVEVMMDGERLHGIDAIPVLHPFLAPPGWRGVLELAAPDRANAAAPEGIP